MTISIRRVSAYLLGTVIFIGGYNATLPVTDIAVPVIFVPIQVFHGIFLDEFFVILFAALALITANTYQPVIRTNWYVRIIAMLLLVLGILGITSALLNWYPSDILKSLRLFYISIFFIILYNFCLKHGSVSALRLYLIGSLIGGAINFYYAFGALVDSNLFGSIPVLMGQAGPGVALGFNVILGLFLVKMSAKRFDILLAFLALCMGLAGAVTSFSKISLISAGCGVMAWVFFLLKEVVVSRRIGVLVFVLVVAACISAFYGDESDIYQSAERVIAVKVAGVGTDDESNDRKRYLYHLAVLEIATNNPVIGVSFSGFYKGLTKTQFAREIAEDPDAERDGSSNPHSALLNYLSAMGFPGGLTALAIMSLAISAISSYSRKSFLFVSCVSISIFIVFLTLPDFFFLRFFFVLLAVVLADLDLKIRVSRILW